MRIPDDQLNCTVFLYPDEMAAQSGERLGGSGFMVGRPFPASGPNHVIVWVVTNRHVIENGAWTIRINTRDGKFSTIDTDESEWFVHPDGDDLAIRPLALNDEFHKVAYLTIDWFLTQDTLNLYAIGPGDPSYVIGRFVNHDGKLKNTPTVRFGQIAQLPIEKVSARGQEQESFLVEIRSIGGYSGSPVFVYLDQAYYRPIQENVSPDGRKAYRGHFESGPWLLGVDWCMIPSWEPVCDDRGYALQNGWMVPANTGIMGVIPCWKLRYLLMEHEPVVKRSKQIEEQELQRPAGSTAQGNPNFGAGRGSVASRPGGVPA